MVPSRAGAGFFQEQTGRRPAPMAAAAVASGCGRPPGSPGLPTFRPAPLRGSRMSAPAPSSSPARTYWTAFIGLLFDYYDLYLFVYLERTLAAAFALTPAASDALQFVGLAGVG